MARWTGCRSTVVRELMGDLREIDLDKYSFVLRNLETLADPPGECQFTGAAGSREGRAGQARPDLKPCGREASLGPCS
jgi:hypothetical protein